MAGVVFGRSQARDGFAGYHDGVRLRPGAFVLSVKTRGGKPPLGAQPV